MTHAREAPWEAACSQLFTERHGEFTFGNDTVTAFDPDWDPLKEPHSKVCPTGQAEACWQAHPGRRGGGRSRHKNLVSN
jgi:hypothetical protein